MSDDLETAGEAGRHARELAAARIRETKRAEFFSQDLVLGGRYSGSPVIADAGKAPGPWWQQAWPGTRLPHLWLSPGVSTLDVVGDAYTALVTDAFEGEVLSRAAASAQLPLSVVTLDAGGLDRLGGESLIVRPDQVVAWRGSASATDLPRLCHRLGGRSPIPHEDVDSARRDSRL